MSTGILEVDCQHQNLDTVLAIAVSSPEDKSRELLHTFAKALSDHFQFEESLTLPNGTPYVDDDHKAEHRQLEQTVAETLSQIQGNDSMVDVIAMEFSRVLMSHAANFDIPASRKSTH